MVGNSSKQGSETPTNFTPRVRVIPAKTKNRIKSESPDGQKKRIGVYARVSTATEMQTSSYELQVSYFTDYVQKNPEWVLVDVYADEGITGTSTKNRTEFNRMIQDCKDKKIDYIITKSISRFARNTLDCLHYIRMLKGLNIGVFFQKENLDTLDSKSELFLTILSSLAQEESRTTSENVKWGIQKRFAQGKIHCPTTYFLGYDTDEDGNIVINEEQAEVVKRIFREFLNGKGTQIIARGLMRDGIQTARGKSKWTSDSVYKILKQEKYMGHCLAQKTVTLDFLTHKRVRNRDIQAQYFIKNTHEEIINEEIFNEVQQELKRRNNLLHDPDKKYRMTYSSRAPFSNRLVCGECGKQVIRRRLTSQKNGEKYLYSAWQCKNSSCHDSEPKNCKGRYLREMDIEKAFTSLLYEMKKNRASVIADSKKAIKECSLTKKEEERLKELESQIEAITNKISELAEKESSKNDAIYDATLRHLIYEQEIFQMEYEGLNESKQESLYLKKQNEELLDYVGGLGDEEKNAVFQPAIFIKTIEHGILNNDKSITFEFKSGISRTVIVEKSK